MAQHEHRREGLTAARKLLGGSVMGLSVLLVVGVWAAQRSVRPPGADYEGRAFEFHEIGDGVYHAVGTGRLAVGCNGSIIVNRDDVMIVDSHISPAAAWALVEELKAITPKPVRYVVNTHFHFDHSHGNQAFSDDVEIIGHEFTREMLADGGSTSGRTYDSFIGGLPDRITGLREGVDATSDAAERARLQAELVIQENHKRATDAVVPTPPTITLSRSLTLHRGGREIRLLFLGRGHTGGDVVVHLPRERVVITGDLLTAGTAYLGDSHPLEWVETLERLKELDFDTVLPGHGQAFEGKAKVGHFQAYLRDFWTQVTAKRTAGVAAMDAAAQIDMRAHAQNYPDIREPGVALNAVLRAYDLLDGTAR